MKKQNFALIALLATALLTSCKKDSKPAADQTTEDQFYKAKVENLVHLSAHPTTAWDLEKSQLPFFKFNTYKEAYVFFQFLEFKDSIRQIDKALRTSLSGERQKDISSIRPLDYFYYNYNFYADPQVSTGIANTFTTGSFLLTYHLQYTLSYGPPTATNNHPSNAMGYYSGLGTIATQNIAIFPNTLPPTNYGKIQGTVQITGSIAGTPFSVYIIISGTYYFTIPPSNDRVYDTQVITTLTARSS